MYLPAFSQIAADFGTKPSSISLSLASYFVGLAIGQLLYGPLLDRYGRKKPLYVGLVIYILTSIGCTFSSGIEALVIFRFIQGLGGCVALVAAMAMVRDFFPVKESAKVFSLLMLILGVSPLLAPTFGGFITVHFGWKWVFIALALIVLLIMVFTYLFLPDGQKPDASVSLGFKPMAATFGTILKTPLFYTYALSGAFSFACLFVYVASSPIIFMEVFKIGPGTYGGIFALLSVGFIGGNQLNVLLLRYYKSEQIFFTALACQVAIAAVFLVGSLGQWYGLIGTIGLYFLSLSCLGLTYPNASAIALAPFTRNIGSASALIGSLQIGTGSLVSACVGVYTIVDNVPVATLMFGSSAIALAILIAGRKRLALEAGQPC
jgi:DHA1 family bicyclomycin/chloramphenicol resistance-like MFS transporter